MASKILLIEDEPIVRLNLKELLTAEGHQVEEAETGDQGIKLALRVLPDLILCDLGLPDFDGYEVVKQLKQRPRTQNTPIVFLTAESRWEAKQRAIRLGSADYIVKPYSRKELLEVIARHLKPQDAIASLFISYPGGFIQYELHDYFYLLGRGESEVLQIGDRTIPKIVIPPSKLTGFISTRHATLHKISAVDGYQHRLFDGCTLQLKKPSSNGLFYNGERIKRYHDFKDGDQLYLQFHSGELRIQYVKNKRDSTETSGKDTDAPTIY